MMKLNIYYSFPVRISFVQNDEKLLRSSFNVTSFHFLQSKSLLAISFFKQFISILFHVKKTNIYVSFFAGYSSFLPALFAKLTNKPHLIILGGTDCVCFKSLNYGNYRKKLLGFATKYSIKNASHLTPVDESLRECIYTYLPQYHGTQGYLKYCNNPETPYTTINIGYDSEKFYCEESKIGNSFLTVGQMSSTNFIRKGIDLIFKMASKFPQCKFTIVGDAPGMDYGPIPDNVTILPFVPYDELRKIYAKHLFYLQLSVMEGFPSAPCEAMLCECVPIVSSVGALPKIVGDTGFILATKDADKLESIIQSAINSNVDLLGKEARNRIISNYPITTRNKLIEVISGLNSL